MTGDFVHLSRYLTGLMLRAPAAVLPEVKAGLRAFCPDMRGVSPEVLLTDHQLLSRLTQHPAAANGVLRLLGSPFSVNLISDLSGSPYGDLLDPALVSPPLPSGGRLRSPRTPTLGEVLQDPRVQPYLTLIDQIWERYLRGTRPTVHRILSEISQFLGRCGGELTFEGLAHLRERFLALGDCIHEAATRIGSLIEDLVREGERSGVGLSREMKAEFIRILLFLQHDIAHIFPYELWRVEGAAKRHGFPDDHRLRRLVSSILHQVFEPGNVETLVQFFSFPLGMIPDLHRMAMQRAIPREPLDLTRAVTVSSGIVFLRLAMVNFLPRIHYQEPGLQPELLFSVGGESSLADCEGVIIRGGLDTVVQTYPNSLFSILYNCLKNTLFAIADHYDEEDPYPVESMKTGSWDRVDQWKANQRRQVRRARIRLDVEVRPDWGGHRLDNLTWVRVRDSAGGFNLNRIWKMAFHLIDGHLREILGLTNGVTAPQRLLDLSLRETQDVIDRLQQRMGLRNRALVERLVQAYLNPRRVNLFTIQDTMELAAIFNLSGSLNPDQIHSGFGLYGINILSPSSGVHYLHFTVPNGADVGTEVVIAVQSQGGFAHSEPEVRGVIESAVGV